MKKVLVLGASLHIDRYSNMAVKKLQGKGFKVIGLGSKTGVVGNAEIVTERVHIGSLYAVTIYLNPLNQKSYYTYIIGLKPQKVIFNPGAENRELEMELDKHDIAHERACTLVLLSLDKF